MMPLQSRAEQYCWPGWVFLAAAVLLLAAIFRLVWLADVPPGLAQDEVLDADIATFIRQGEHALFFRHGYGHEPLYHYYAVPFQVLLGDNVLSVRLPAAFLGLLLVALTMRWAWRDFGRIAALTAGLGLAISWWPIIFSRIGIRPILEPVLLVISVLFWARRPWLAGLFLGLTLYSYTAARVLLLLPLLFALYLWWLGRRSTRTEYRYRLRTTLMVLLVAVLISLPLGYVLWANPDLQQRVEQLEGPLEALRQDDPGPVVQMSLATLGVFSFTGDPRWTYSVPGRPLFDPLTAVFFYAGLALTLWHWRRPPYAFLLIWLAITLIPSAVTPDAPSTVRLVGAMPLIYLLPGLAVAAIIRQVQLSKHFGLERFGFGQRSELPDRAALQPVLQRRSERRSFVVLRWSVGLLLLLILLVNVWRTAAGGFIRWPAALETRLRYQAVLLDVARHWKAQEAGAPVLAEVFFEPIDADSLRRHAGQPVAARWVQTGAGVAGAMVWPKDTPAAQLYVPEYSPLDPDLMALAGIPSRPEHRSNAIPSFAVYQLPPEPAITLERSGAQFGGGLTLLGYVILPVEDGQLPLATYWRVDAPLATDLSLFAHVLDGQGQNFAQHDGLDAAASTLIPGDRFLQRHQIPLPAGGHADDYLIQVGAYTRGDGRRLMVTNCDSINQACASPAADAVTLGDWTSNATQP
jgi:4-amino-4-deoxy-L-arabinose transferase-like glycosyltransferase